MADEKYYEFVFSKNEIITAALNQSLSSIKVELINPKVNSSLKINCELFEFGEEPNDAYCIRSKTTNKCALFEKLILSRPLLST